MNIYVKILTAALSMLILETGCKRADKETPSTVDQAVIGLTVEPTVLSPILSTTSNDREVFQFMFAQLADHDYETLEFKPVLIKEIPKEEIVEEGLYKGATAYEMEIRADAVWSNGDPITGYDALFTYKVCLHPGVKAPSVKEFLKDFIDLKVDESNPKKFTFYSSNTNFQTKEYLLGFEIYPKHIYDGKSILDNTSIADLKDENALTLLMQDTAFANVGRSFSSQKFTRELVEGAGPYKLESWESGQFIVLKKKDNYWGSNYKDIDQLESYPDRIIFQFASDANVLVTLLKNEEIDVVDLSKMPYTQFDDLKQDSNFISKFKFYTPQIPRYLILLLNNEDERLSDKRVRKAIAHLTNTDRLIKQLEGGYARRVNSPIHFSTKEYNRDLPFNDFNVDLAKNLLEEAGWSDSDGNGVRDKVIAGKKVDFKLRFHYTGSDISTSLYNIVKEGCDQAGIELIPVIKPYGATRVENLITGDYEMTVMMKTIPPVKRDLFSSYHSSSIGLGGANYQRFAHEEADGLMTLIRETRNDAERSKAYKRLQEIFSEETPVIYLYSQQLRIVSDKDFNLSITNKRPGYFANAIAE